MKYLRHYFFIFIFILYSPISYAEDNLLLDLDIDLEDHSASAEMKPQIVPDPKKETTPPQEITKKESPKPSIKKTSSSKVRKHKKRKNKKNTDNLDLLTKLRSGIPFTIDDVEIWIAQTQDINMCLDNGKTMLLYLISNSNNVEALSLLIEFGADVQTHCTPRYEALFVAVINNTSVDVIDYLINNGANLVESDNEKNTAIHLAATFNPNAAIIDTLLEYGLKLNEKNKFGYDPLMLATYSNKNIDVLQSLIDNGADVNATDEQGHTPLMAAAIRGDKNFIKYLIKRGADYKAVDKNGLSLIDYAYKRKYLKTLNFKINEFATPSEKLSAEFDFITKNHHRFNVALKESIFKENPEQAVEDAIKNLADIDILNQNGCTTFLNACINNNSQEVLSKILQGKANINATCLGSKNALMFLAGQADKNPKPQIEKAKLLINQDIDINHTDENGNTALIYALGNNADSNFIMTLLINNADTNIVNNEGETALWTAIRQNLSAKIVKSLIEYGADVNYTDARGETPLWYALRTNKDEFTIQTLLRGGSDVNITNAAGDLPLWYALTKNLSDLIIENIIYVQKDLNIKNAQGETPLIYAIKNDFSPNLIKLLIKHGADPKIADRNGFNAYEILKQNRYYNDAVKKRRKERVLNDWQ